MLHLQPPRELVQSTQGAPVLRVMPRLFLFAVAEFDLNLNSQVVEKRVELGTETAALPRLERFKRNVVAANPRNSCNSGTVKNYTFGGCY